MVSIPTSRLRLGNWIFCASPWLGKDGMNHVLAMMLPTSLFLKRRLASFDFRISHHLIINYSFIRGHFFVIIYLTNIRIANLDARPVSSKPAHYKFNDDDFLNLWKSYVHMTSMKRQKSWH